MANQAHLDAISQGAHHWNKWRHAHPEIKFPDLSRAELHSADLRDANLVGVNMFGAHAGQADFRGAQLAKVDFLQSRLYLADFRGAKIDDTMFTHADITGARFEHTDVRGAIFRFSDLEGAHFDDADLRGVDFSFAHLRRTTFSNAKLQRAELFGAILEEAVLENANLEEANLSLSVVVNANFADAVLSEANVFGASVWKTNLDGAIQNNLRIADEGEPDLMVDDLEVAQFIYLLVSREKIRNVINTVTKKGVLILGRFGDGGVELLQAVAAWLRKPENGGYLPLLFDFPRPESKTYTETIRTLAGLARFVIVDLSGPSVPQEITATVDLHEIPFVPILESKRDNWSMFRDFLVKERVLDPIPFANQEQLLKVLGEKVVKPAERLIEKRQKKLDQIFGKPDPAGNK